MIKWMRRNRGHSLVEANAALIIMTVVILASCVFYACSVLFAHPAGDASLDQPANAVANAADGGSAAPLAPIARSMGMDGTRPVEPTDERGRS